MITPIAKPQIKPVINPVNILIKFVLSQKPNSWPKPSIDKGKIPRIITYKNLLFKDIVQNTMNPKLTAIPNQIAVHLLQKGIWFPLMYNDLSDF